MKWYETGEVAERLQNIIDAYIDDFMDKDEFASELDALGLSYEEQNVILQEQIRLLEMQLASRASGTVH